MKNKVLMSLVLVTFLIGTSISIGKPDDEGPSYVVYLDMNDDISWKDADSYREEGPDYTMQMDVAVLWNNYDYAEAHDIGWVNDYVYVSIYCYGARYGYYNRVQLRVWTSEDGWSTESTKTCTYGSWNVVTWGLYIERSGETRYRFKLNSGYLKYGPKDDWDPAISHDDGALIEIDPSTSGADYYFMTGTTFYSVDSCYDGRPDCPDLHSEVSNHVVWLHDGDYLLTRDFYIPSYTSVDFYFDELCLTSTCTIEVKIDGSHWKTLQFSNDGWACMHLGEKYLNQGWHNVRIYNREIGYPDSDVAWERVWYTY